MATYTITKLAVPIRVTPLTLNVTKYGGGGTSIVNTYLNMSLADLKALLDVSGTETVGKDLRAILGLAAAAQ